MIIHVNRHVLTKNRKTGEREPPIAVKNSKSGKSIYVSAFSGQGRFRVIYSPDSPLPCGATVWIEFTQDT